MRLTSFGIVLVLMASVFAGRSLAQIPERALFQPGSYAFGAYQNQDTGMGQPSLMVAPGEDVPAQTEEAADSQNEWEETFALPATGPNKTTDAVAMDAAAMVVVAPQKQAPPYLAYHRNPWTGRIHVIPYQKGYAENPDAFPKSQTKLNLWLSTLPGRTQNQPQVEYLGYYDPMPEIITDRPSRLQLMLGYPNSKWTSCCDNRWGDRLAQCPGVDLPAMGPYAEPSIQEQEYYPAYSNNAFGGYGNHRTSRFGTRMSGQRAWGASPSMVSGPQMSPNFAQTAPYQAGTCPCRHCQAKQRAVCPPEKSLPLRKAPACDIEMEAY